MPGTTPTLGLPFPELTDPPDGAAQLQALAEAVEAELVARAKGLVDRVQVGTSTDVGTTEVITDDITFTVEAGRAYKVTVVTPVLDNQATAAQTAVVTLRHAAGGSVSNSATLIGKAVKNVPAATGSSTPGSAAVTTMLVGWIEGAAAGTRTVGLGLAALSSGSDVRFLASGTSGPDSYGVFSVEDAGPAS